MIDDDAPIIDLFEFVTDIRVDPTGDHLTEHIRGLRNLGPVTITGRWGHWERCVRCGLDHSRDGDGPHAHATLADVDLGPICDACAVEVMSDE